MKRINLDPIEKLLIGVNKVADTVGGTLGPKGRNVFLDTVPPRITNDGKTIADSIELEDREENLGAWLVKNAAAQTNDDVGDGTTTTSILTAEIIKEALKRPENKMEVAQSLKAALPAVLEAIKANSQPVTDILQVARISAEDETLAKNIAELVEKVGAEGTIRVEENSEPEISYEVVDGYEAGVGFLSPHLINTSKLTCEFEDAPIYVSQKKISNLQEIAPLFEQLKELKTSKIVMVAEDFENEVLGVLVANKKMGLLNILVLRATGPLLEDIAAATGATMISDNDGVTFDTFNAKNHLGQAKVISAEKKTLFISKAETAKKHAERLEAFADMNPNKWEGDRFRERAAKLRKGIAVLRVGSASTVDMTYLKDKADDAVHATQAALQEGVVEGGGMCLWRIGQSLTKSIELADYPTVGGQIMAKALKSPLKRICQNAGREYADIVTGLTDREGYNAKTDTIADLFAEGVIDPAKVERVAVTNATLNAATFITTHAAILEVTETK